MFEAGPMDAIESPSGMRNARLFTVKPHNGRRDEPVALGAVEVTLRELAEMTQARRPGGPIFK